MLVPSMALVAARHRGLDFFARGDQVGLQPAVPGRPAAGEVAHTIRVRHRSMGGPDGDDPFTLPGSVSAHRPVALCDVTELGRTAKVPLVAGGCHDKDT